MQTPRKFKEHDATADGLLKKMNNVKFVHTHLILNKVLPHLSTLSKVSQQHKIHYSAINLSLESTKRRITEVRSSRKPLHVLKRSFDMPMQRLGANSSLITGRGIGQPVPKLHRNTGREPGQMLHLGYSGITEPGQMLHLGYSGITGLQHL